VLISLLWLEKKRAAQPERPKKMVKAGNRKWDGLVMTDRRIRSCIWLLVPKEECRLARIKRSGKDQALQANGRIAASGYTAAPGTIKSQSAVLWPVDVRWTALLGRKESPRQARALRSEYGV